MRRFGIWSSPTSTAIWARAIERTPPQRGGCRVSEVVGDAATRFEAAHPGVYVGCNLDSEARAALPADRLLELVIELLETAAAGRASAAGPVWLSSSAERAGATVAAMRAVPPPIPWERLAHLERAARLHGVRLSVERRFHRLVVTLWLPG